MPDTDDQPITSAGNAPAGNSPSWMTRDVSVILGIGNVASTALGRIHVVTVGDLLRARPDQLQFALKTIASDEQAQKWRYAAALLQVRGVTPHIADILVRNNIYSPDELGHQTLSVLEQLLSTLPASTPKLSPDNIAHMLCDATVLAHTGSIMGTVRDKQGKPIAGVKVTLGGQQQTTDQHGRFHLRRIALGQPAILTLAHAAYATLTQENPIVLTDSLATGVRIFTLDAVVLTSAPAPSSPAAASPQSAALSEWAGDILPIPSGQPVRELMGSVADLREGDILRWQMSYASGQEIKLVSRFKSYADGAFVVQVYRIPQNLLPANATLRQHFRWHQGSLASINLNLDSFHRELLRRRMLKHFDKTSAALLPAATASRKKAVRDRIQYLAEAGAFKGSKEYLA